jgi:hypothetical protein
MIFLHEKINLQNEKFIDNGFWKVKDATTFPEVGEKIIVENYSGGHHYHTVQPKDEFIEGYWENLMKIYATEISKQNYGWIDRDGIFYRCDYMEHAFIANACFNMTEAMAEVKGYVKIYKDPFDTADRAWFCDKYLTRAQYNKLVELGFEDIEDEKIE